MSKKIDWLVVAQRSCSTKRSCLLLTSGWRIFLKMVSRLRYSPRSRRFVVTLRICSFHMSTRTRLLRSGSSFSFLLILSKVGPTRLRWLTNILALSDSLVTEVWFSTRFSQHAHYVALYMIEDMEHILLICNNFGDKRLLKTADLIFLIQKHEDDGMLKLLLVVFRRTMTLW